VQKAIRRGSAEDEVRKHRDRVTGAWKQISKQRRGGNVQSWMTIKQTEIPAQPEFLQRIIICVFYACIEI